MRRKPEPFPQCPRPPAASCGPVRLNSLCRSAGTNKALAFEVDRDKGVVPVVGHHYDIVELQVIDADVHRLVRPPRVEFLPYPSGWVQVVFKRKAEPLENGSPALLQPRKQRTDTRSPVHAVYAIASGHCLRALRTRYAPVPQGIGFPRERYFEIG